MLTIQTCVVVLLTVSGILFQQPGPTATPTTNATSTSIPTSPASATDAALGATSTALAATSASLSATTQALLNQATNGPTGQTSGTAPSTGGTTNGPTGQAPRQLPSTGGGTSPWSILAELTLLFLVAGAWLRLRSKSN